MLILLDLSGWLTLFHGEGEVGKTRSISERGGGSTLPAAGYENSTKKMLYCPAAKWATLPPNRRQAMPGPPPTPLNLRILRGNPGKRPLPVNEPRPEIAEVCPEPPPFLDRYAAAEWQAVAPQLHALGLLTVVDVACLSAYCSAYATWRTHRRELGTHGRQRSGDERPDNQRQIR
jgi:hypothetical protein